MRACIIDFNDDDDPDVMKAPGEKLFYLQEQKKHYCSGKSGARTSNPCAHLSSVLLCILLIHIGKLDEFIQKMTPKYREPLNCGYYKNWLAEHGESDYGQDDIDVTQSGNENNAENENREPRLIIDFDN